MVTLKDIAAAAGVSTMTVSNVLRGKPNVSQQTAQRIIETAKAMNYQASIRSMAASSLRRAPDKQRNVMGFAMSDINEPWPAKIAQGALAEARSMGYDMILEETQILEENERTAVERINDHFYDGLILSHSSMTSAHLDQLARHRPLVIVDYTEPQSDVDTVLTDSEEGAYNGIQYLAGRGYRTILVVGASPDDDPGAYRINRVRSLRLAGALRALNDLGLPHGPSAFLDIDWRHDLAREAINHMGRTYVDEFDAILALNSLLSIGVMRGLRDLGLEVPSDIALMGCSGIDADDYMTPSLTTVDLAPGAIGHAAVRMLVSRLNGDTSPARQITIPHTIRPRESA